MNDLPSLTLNIFLGLLSSLIASFLYFYLFFINLKPKITIADKVSKLVNKDNHLEYEIKIINANPRRSTINVKAELLLVTRRSIPGGMVLETEHVPLFRDEIFEITRFDPKKNVNEDEARYAFRFRSIQSKKEEPSLEQQWEDDTNTYLLFRVFATDPLTGLGKIFSKQYYKKETDIIEGDYGFGPSLEVVPKR